MSDWDNLEKKVRFIASLHWPQRFVSELVHGRQIDAYARLDTGHAIAIEVTMERNISKLQEDINKLTHVRNVNYQNGFIVTDCYCITAYEPTPAMNNVAAAINVTLLSVDAFTAKYLPYDAYKEARASEPFGSAADPISGKRDTKKYIFVEMEAENGTKFNAKALLDMIVTGSNVVLTGEYGTGKSKCIQYIFDTLSNEAWKKTRFPVSIDLRKCWGLKDRNEIIRRHVTDLNIAETSDSFIKAFNQGLLILLIDGFDEMASQVWTDNSSQLRAIRADALSGIRDLILHHTGPLIITGRDHYFDNKDEMISSLGLANKPKLEIVKTKDEFSHQELSDFLETQNIDVEVPEWLPRKPLTCEFFVGLKTAIDDEKLADALNAAQFWSLIIDAVCQREARTNPSLDPFAIKSVLVEVAAITRQKPENVGPLSLSEIQAAFERAVGYTPIEQATVLLQRLPGLGRASADTNDRRFIDTYLLEGLRAVDVQNVLQGVNARALSERWTNPIGENGAVICGHQIDLSEGVDKAIEFCLKNSNCNNQTLLLDIVCSILCSSTSNIDFKGLSVSNAYASTMDLSEKRFSNFLIDTCMIDKLVIVGSDAQNSKFVGCEIVKLEGVSSQNGVPTWIDHAQIDGFSSVATTSRIKSAKLAPAQKVLVTILRKTFFQKGAGRKEEALTRGLGRLVKPGTQTKILGRLKSEGLIFETKGDEGALFIPNRSEARRAGKIISELSLSKDPIWDYVSQLSD